MKLLLIDGSNLIFRAYYATEHLEIRNSNNEKVNAVQTLISMIDKMVNEEKPTHMFIAMDSGKATFRHEMYEEYKGTRTSTPDDLKNQFPIIKEYFESLGIKSFSLEKYEADDLIATYANIAQDKGFDVKIVSGDKDLLQLVTDKIHVTTPKMGFAKECTYTNEVFYEKYGFKPNRFVEYKALVGDTSDNIIGIEKLGDKTAKKYIMASEDINEIINQANEGVIKGKVVENLKNNIDRIHTNIKLVTLVKDIKLNTELDELKFNGYSKTYIDFLKKQGFNKIYNKYVKDNNIEVEKFNFSYKKITKFDEKKHTDEVTSVYLQTLSENYIISQKMGIGLSSKKGNFYLSIDQVDDEFIKYIESENKKIFYNLKQLLVSLKIHNVSGIIIDLYLGLSLIHPSNYKKDVDENLHAYGIDYIKPYQEVYHAKNNPIVPEDFELVIEDICLKTFALLESYEKVESEINKQGLTNILNDIEIPLSITLSKIEENGVYINQEYLEELQNQYEDKVDELEEKLSEFTNININSTQQLSTFLFEELKLPKQGLKKTTKSISTDVDNLEKLIVMLKNDETKYKEQIKFINMILEYRKYTKILNTYIINIKRFILKDGRIHPINHQLLTETGRLSVMDPNIQNMPIRSKEGSDIRKLVSTAKDKVIIALDYSQVELRVIASLSQDKSMIEAFNNGYDIHEETAKKIFNLSEVSSIQRSKAKAINFGIVYGISPYGLAKQVGISNDEAKLFIDTYFKEYPGIKEYIDQVILKVQEEGNIRTLFGRNRVVPNINSKNYKEREHSQRIAINTPIQGTAADIMKMALIKVDEELNKQNFNSKIIMQIHDEIVLEVPKDEVQELINIVKKTMEEVVQLPVKLKVDYGKGKTWLDAK